MANMTLKVGKAAAEVSLIKMVSPQKEAKHEVRWVPVDEPGMPVAQTPPEEPVSMFAPEPVAAPVVDPFETGPAPALPNDVFAEDVSTVTYGGSTPTQSVSSIAPQEVKQQGIWDSEGEWVDLTKLLSAIDDETKIDGMLLEASLTQQAIPREHVKGAFYVSPKNPAAHKFCALIWHGLRSADRAAIVRWTKRTNQALGMVVARGQAKGVGKNRPYLVVIELEWPENIKSVPEGVYLDMDVVGGNMAKFAVDAIRGIEEDAKYVAGLRDERNAQRAELIQASRDGKTWKHPTAIKSAEMDTFAALLLEV